MPPSHPRPEDLAALGTALSAAAEHTATASEHLLDHMVTVGDHATQAAVDGLIDASADALREISVSARELTLGLAAAAPIASGSAHHDEGIRAPRVRQLR